MSETQATFPLQSVPTLARRVLATIQNGIEIARFGGFGEPTHSPYTVAAEGENHQLRHYFPDFAPADEHDGPPILLIPPLMLSAEVWDVSDAASAVAALHRGGCDPWVVDFGSPEAIEGGLARNLSDHVLAVAEAVAQVREATGRDVHLTGYSQGGMFAYQAAAYLRSEGIASLITFGSPVDTHSVLPPILPTEVLIDGIEMISNIQNALLPRGIPAWATRAAFQIIDPIKAVQQQIDFALRLYDREALASREGMRRFMSGEGWEAFPGPALRDAVEQLVAENRLLQGGVVVGDRPITLSDISCPVLTFIGDSDFIAPAPAARAIATAAPDAECYDAGVSAGHFGLVAGTRSVESTWPIVVNWLRWQEGVGTPPEAINRIDPAELAAEDDEPSALDEIAGSLGRIFNIGRDALGGAAQEFNDRAGILSRVLGVITPQIPRLGRLATMRSDTPMSLGRALAERATSTPNETFFLFEGRAYSYREANVRVDNVVKGFIQCGVKHGEHVGLLMDTRPSALAAAVALSRIGAIAVMLRPDTDIAAQLTIAPVDHLLADPENAEDAREAFGADVMVLGGGGDPRTLPQGLIDMEDIDPDLVDLPSWYSADPGAAGELAFILITGDGANIKTSRVSNRRWATSAYGTASGCALTSHDTVYCCSPTHHATGILVATGGALVSGARLAIARTFDYETFWNDVRRYGVNVVFYSGTLCRELVNAPESAYESRNPIRLFAGSGLPKNLWRRLQERFPHAKTVEFFATTEGNAVLVNLSGHKIGSIGRPLPGGSELGTALWNLESECVVEQPGGFARRSGAGEVGLLLARIDPSRGEVGDRPLRGVFEPGDAWLSTGELVTHDPDGDYWLVDHARDVIHTVYGSVPTIGIEDLLTRELDFIDLVAVYGVKLDALAGEIPVAAMTLRPGHEFDAQALRRVVQERIARHQRPVVIRLLDDLPMTAGYRIRKGPLRREGVGLHATRGDLLWLPSAEDSYIPLQGRNDALIEQSFAGIF